MMTLVGQAHLLCYTVFLFVVLLLLCWLVFFPHFCLLYLCFCCFDCVSFVFVFNRLFCVASFVLACLLFPFVFVFFVCFVCFYFPLLLIRLRDAAADIFCLLLLCVCIVYCYLLLFCLTLLLSCLFCVVCLAFLFAFVRIIMLFVYVFLCFCVFFVSFCCFPPLASRRSGMLQPINLKATTSSAPSSMAFTSYDLGFRV